MIRLHTVHPHDRDLLWNINQKYLYEMAEFYPEEMDEAGNLHYGHFEEYSQIRSTTKRTSPGRDCGTWLRSRMNRRFAT